MLKGTAVEVCKGRDFPKPPQYRRGVCARSHHVLSGVAGDEQLGGTRIHEDDASESDGRKATVDHGHCYKRRMVH